MLVLSRKIGQRIVLPDQGVTISVLAVGKERVRIGIVAPGGTAVHRNEVWQRICDEHSHVEMAASNGGRRTEFKTAGHRPSI
jgi:carbon storage regulator CsrA